ncbi:MAG: hypothetical protein OEV87_03465 [Phycisphaerae bacterium]|nr:hypothetical protein [Phycisphaerae bacterium]
MKIGRIIHQQVMQLRWHFLSCLGLLMALPIEEAFINLRDGHGFYVTGLSLGIPIVVAPLLAGLIACGNVQADLDENRFIFWRSKPVGVKTFMTIKYLVGLFMAFVVIASPVLFAIISCKFVQYERIELGIYQAMGNSLMISLLAYSLCFFCNTLVRKTARAWLIGMAVTVFLLLVPFVLPLNFKDVVSSFRYFSVIYLVITLTPSLVAFIISLVAVSRDWHLQTNLKGLLWTGASLIFLLMLLFTRQVANIKVLDEEEIYNAYPRCMKRIDGKLLLETQSIRELGSSPEKQTCENFYINIENNQIHFDTIDDPLLRYRGAIFAPEASNENEHATGNLIFKKNDGNLYIVSMYVNSRRVKPSRSQTVHENVYLRSYDLSNPKFEMVSEIDLSEFVENPQSWPDVVMRQIENKIIAIVNGSCVVVEFGPKGQLKVAEKLVRKIRVGPAYWKGKQFSVPIVPLESISLEDRIKLSLDLATVDGSYYLKDLSARVDKRDGQYYFIAVSESGITRYQVIGWDDKFIQCEIKDYRAFTVLEHMVDDTWKYKSQYFIKDGILYTYANKSLVVFDIRSDRIRKLGHYIRPKQIEDIEVLDNGDILLCAETEKGFRIPSDASSREVNYLVRSGCFTGKVCLSLLKNPK